MRSILFFICRFMLVVGIACLITRAASAQIRLTELVSVGTTSTGTYVDRYDWHTSALPSGAYNIWLIEGTDLNGAFLNGPGRANSAIDIPLSLGDHTFTLYSAPNPALGEVPYYGINLGFTGSAPDPDPLRPKISAYAPTALTTTPSLTNFVANGSTTRYYDVLVPAANTLSYTNGGFTVTLTEFFNAARNVYNRDRVSAYSTSGDQAVDNIGRVTLRVTAAAPEPSALLLLVTGLTCGVIAPFRLRRFRQKAV